MSDKITISKHLLVQLLDYVEPEEQRNYEEWIDENGYYDENHTLPHIYNTILALRQRLNK